MIGLDQRIGEFGGTEADFGQIAADALDDEVLADTARHPTGDDIRAILMACAG
jgi:alcohol dehydrogenase class IV